MLGFLKSLFRRTLPRDSRTVSEKPLSPAAKAWLYYDSDGKPLSAAAQAFIEGSTTSLTSADLDERNAESFARYSQACGLKEQGNFEGAARLLEASCTPPSIYTGHYRLLFQIWRQFNRTDLKAGRHGPVVERVTKMVRYDDEMVSALLEYWGNVQGKKLSSDHFDDARNLKVSDAKALLAAADALSRNDLAATAHSLIRRFAKKSR